MRHGQMWLTNQSPATKELDSMLSTRNSKSEIPIHDIQKPHGEVLILAIFQVWKLTRADAPQGLSRLRAHGQIRVPSRIV
jgi:hypothetical protein